MRMILKCERFSNANASHLKAFKGRPPYSQSDTLLKASKSWSKLVEAVSVFHVKRLQACHSFKKS
jgi:hypothetical protein